QAAPGSGATRAKKAPVYEKMVFSVAARGTMDNVQAMMKEFYKTSLMHQIRNLNLDVATQRAGGGAGGRGGIIAPGSLDMNMTVGALLISGAKERAGLLPSKLPYQLRVLAEPTRDYALLDKRNVFTGIAAPDREGAKQAEEKSEVLRFVKLTIL